MADDPDHIALTEALGASQRLGFLGDLPIPEVIAHARYFVAAIERWGGSDALDIADIGSGGGVPGLVVATDLPSTSVCLIDRRAARTDHLARLVRRLRLSSRVAVRNADLTATPSDLRERFDVVTARGFGPPSATLAAARPLLRPGGIAVISEPPAGAEDRWTDDLLASHTLVRRTPPGGEVVVLQTA